MVMTRKSPENSMAGNKHSVFIRYGTNSYCNYIIILLTHIY
jgi:hypothetical protein